MDGSTVKEKSEKRGTVIPTIPPTDLQEFSTTSIFNGPEDLPQKISPLGPYITSETLHLSPAEKQLLSKDPKYSLVYPPSRMKLSIEIERMNAKTRYNDGSKKKNDKDNSQQTNRKARITKEDGTAINWYDKKDGRESGDMTKLQGKKRHLEEPTNLTKDEVVALKNLKDRIKQGELIVSQTDKSSRFTVMTGKTIYGLGQSSYCKRSRDRLETG